MNIHEFGSIGEHMPCWSWHREEQGNEEQCKDLSALGWGQGRPNEGESVRTVPDVQRLGSFIHQWHIQQHFITTKTSFCSSIQSLLVDRQSENPHICFYCHSGAKTLHVTLTKQSASWITSEWETSLCHKATNGGKNVKNDLQNILDNGSSCRENLGNYSKFNYFVEVPAPTCHFLTCDHVIGVKAS